MGSQIPSTHVENICTILLRSWCRSAVWGKKWSGELLLVHLDNVATVAIVNSGNSHDSKVMHLVLCLAFIAAKFQLYTYQERNYLSRCAVQPLFHCLFSQAHQHQTEVPVALVDLLLGSHPDWTSTKCAELWNTIFPWDYVASATRNQGQWNQGARGAGVPLKCKVGWLSLP